jgi:FMN-dependent NADH-azoreductase
MVLYYSSSPTYRDIYIPATPLNSSGNTYHNDFENKLRQRNSGAEFRRENLDTDENTSSNTNTFQSASASTFQSASANTFQIYTTTDKLLSEIKNYLFYVLILLLFLVIK